MKKNYFPVSPKKKSRNNQPKNWSLLFVPPRERLCLCNLTANHFVRWWWWCASVTQLHIYVEGCLCYNIIFSPLWPARSARLLNCFVEARCYFWPRNLSASALSRRRAKKKIVKKKEIFSNPRYFPSFNPQSSVISPQPPFLPHEELSFMSHILFFCVCVCVSLRWSVFWLNGFLGTFLSDFKENGKSLLFSLFPRCR